MFSLTAIAAVAENGVIAKDGKIPWYIPEDREFFKSTIQGEPIIEGRRTYKGESRTSDLNIVLTRSGLETVPDGVAVANSPEEAVTILVEQEIDHAYVIGGGEVYQAMLPYTDHLIISEVSGEYEGDTYFPEIGEGWEEIDREPRDRFDIVRYTRNE